MNTNEWLILIEENLATITWLQFIAVALGVTQVLLAKKNNIWLYPTGIASTLISMFLLFEVKLYAESLLNLYYVIMSIYGWIFWVRKRHLEPLKISYSSKNDWKITLCIVFIGWGILYSLLTNFTDSDVPVWDSIVSSTAWAGMWLLAGRKIENWILLNISNLFAIPLLIHKSLPLFAALTFFLFIVAFFGYFEWKKRYQQERDK